MRVFNNANMKSISQLLESHVLHNKSKPAITQLLHRYQSKIDGQVFKESTPHKNMVYANNYLNYGDLKVIGFDLDYTLVSYTVELQNLIYTLARDVLINAYGYPHDLSDFEFDPKFAIRGLTVDARHGILSKLSHLQRLALSRTYRGKQQLSAEDMQRYYGDSRHVPYGDLSQMRPLNDLFSVAEACLISDTMELFLNQAKLAGNGESSFDPTAIVNDVQHAISDVHINGSMQSAVLSNPECYIKDSPDLGRMLAHVKDSGKKTFLCTNSGYNYSNKALNHALGLKSDSTEWRDLFDVVICSAKKPDFYNSRLPFRQFNLTKNSPTTSPVGTLAKGQVYVQGSAHALLRATGWRGQEVLYLGDNLRTDLVEARRWHGWHTGCIINELDTEINTQQSPECKELHFLRSTLRNLMYDLQLEMHMPPCGVDTTSLAIKPNSSSSSISYNGNDESSLSFNTTNNSNNNNSNISSSSSTSCSPSGRHFDTPDEALLSAIELELQEINSQLSKLFNPHFGSVFRTDGHPSLFAFAMLRYVDLYMSDVCNLLHYNPSHRFYPYHAMHMAHDPASASATLRNSAPAAAATLFSSNQ